MRVAIVSDVLPPLIDGVTRTMTELARTLADRRMSYRFVSAMAPPDEPPWADRAQVVRSAPLVFYQGYRVGVPRKQELQGALDAFAPDVVHVVSPSFLGLQALRYAERRGLPAVASFHTDFAACLPFYGLGALEPFAWRLVRAFYNRFAATFAPSRHVAARLEAHGVRDVRIWPRGVDPTRFSPRFRSRALRRAVAPDDVPILLYVGRLRREKNLDYLVAAAHELERRRVAFRLVLVGDGPLAPQLRASLPRAHFAGALRGEELSRWYASADLFVFPSRVETFGNVVLEAFASGVPVAAVAAGAVRELVAHGETGILADPADPIVFAAMVQDLVRDPTELARRSARALLASRSHRWSDVNGRLLADYAMIVGEPLASRAPSVPRRPTTSRRREATDMTAAPPG